MCAQAVSQLVPHFASTLFGREAELTLLDQLIDDPTYPIITITGTSGIGKTRLAAHVARFVDAPDTLFVPLATIVDPDLVVSELGQALGLQEGSWQDSIPEKLQDWNGIVVLDNFEQVIDAAADLASILPNNPSLTVIITSQRPLQIEGERIVRLEPLTVPAGKSNTKELRHTASVQMLVERTASLDTSILEAMKSDSTALAVGDICRRLDGLPLALELAASRLASLTPEVVLQQLEQGQSILSGNRRDVPERHRTMQAAILWSVELLPAETQRTFLWLGAFTGGFDLEIVAQLGDQLETDDDLIDTISELVTLNLVRRVRGGSQPWYAMLEPIRAFCLAELERLGELAAAQDVVGKHVLNLAVESESRLIGAESAAWTERLTLNFPTIRSAVERSISLQEPRLPMLVGFGLRRYMEQTGRWKEGVGWITAAQAWSDKLTPGDYAHGLLAKMEMRAAGREFEAAIQTRGTLEALLDEHDLPDVRATMLVVVAAIETRQHHLDIAEGLFLEAIDLNQHLGLQHNLARAFTNLGYNYRLRGEYELAKTHLLQGSAAMESIGNHAGNATALRMLATNANLQDDLESALQYTDRAVEISRNYNLPLELMHSLSTQVSILGSIGRYDDALRIARETVQLCHQNDHPLLGADVLHKMGAIAREQGDNPALGGYFLAAMNQASVSKTPMLFAEIGNYLASALAKSGHYAEAAIILGGFDTYVSEIEYHLRTYAADLQRETTQILEQNLESVDQHIDAGRVLSTEEWVARMKQTTRLLTGRSGVLLVKIPEPGPLAGLTRREKEIVQLLTDGQSTASMAEVLSVSPRTVTTHIGNIMGKLEVSSRAELVAKILRTGPA